MGSGASVAADIENEVPWDYSQEFIDGVRKQIVGTSPAVARKLEFQKQVRMVGRSVQHLKLIRTMQASFLAGKKPSVLKKQQQKKKPPSQQPATDGGGQDGDSPKAAGRGQPAAAPEDEITDSERMQQLLLEEMKEAGVELDGQLAEELERRRLQEEADKAAGKLNQKPKKKKKKKGLSLLSIQTRLAGCNQEPFDNEDEEEFLAALEDINGDDMLKTKDMLDNFQFATPTVSRTALRTMDFPFVHGCIIGVFERAGYQPDLLVEDDKDELKFEGRREEEVFLIKVAAAVAFDLGTIDPEAMARSGGPKGTDMLPDIDIYHVCVGELRQDLKPPEEAVGDDDEEEEDAGGLLSAGVSTEAEKKKKKSKKASGRYLSKEEFVTKYGSERRYNFMKSVDDPSVARAFLQYVCLAAGEMTSSRKRMHCPRRVDPDGDAPSTKREFLFKYGEEKGEELWEYQHPHREQERAIKREQERQRMERALLLKKEELARRKLELEQRMEHRRTVFMHRHHVGYDAPCGCEWCLHNDTYNDAPGQFAPRTGKLMPKVDKAVQYDDDVVTDAAVFAPGAVDVLHAGCAADSLSCDFLY